MNNGYYPIGAANDSRAPWNDTEIEEVEIDTEYSCTMYKTTTILTNDYEPGEYETDEDGSYYRVDDDFSDTDFLGEFKSQHRTPGQLINILAEIADDYVNGNTPDKSLAEWKRIAADCQGWTTEEEDAMEA